MTPFAERAWISTEDRELVILKELYWSPSAVEGKYSVYVPYYHPRAQEGWFIADQVEFFSAQPQDFQAKDKIEFAIKPDKRFFELAYLELQSLISSQVMEKGVPYSYAVLADFADPLQRSKQLLSSVQDSRRLFGLWENDISGIWGLTPELLFSKRGQVVTTMALAGSKPKDQQDFRSKDYREHQYVIDDIREQFSYYGNVLVGDTQTVSLAIIDHLYTPITLHLNQEVAPEALIQALHPTPALGVYPRGPEGDKWLRDLEITHQRKRFGAPFAMRFPNGDIDCLVAIRCLQLNEGKLEVSAGCGVVKQSSLDREWDELNLKMQSITRLWT